MSEQAVSLNLGFGPIFFSREVTHLTAPFEYMIAVRMRGQEHRKPVPVQPKSQPALCAGMGDEPHEESEREDDGPFVFPHDPLTSLDTVLVDPHDL